MGCIRFYATRVCLTASDTEIAQYGQSRTSDIQSHTYFKDCVWIYPLVPERLSERCYRSLINLFDKQGLWCASFNFMHAVSRI